MTTELGSLSERFTSTSEEMRQQAKRASAEIFWNALYIDIVWVDEDHRRRGYGAALLRRAEDAGRAESCDVAYLSTFDFQAPGFYERSGYDVLGELQDVPPGSRSRWFCKKLRGHGV